MSAALVRVCSLVLTACSLTGPSSLDATGLDAPGVTGGPHALGIDADCRRWIGTMTGPDRSPEPRQASVDGGTVF
ncbi:hypothetical protein BSZ37_13050 [Rubrivirga marina]|uniref:Uncharacterized protein n=1 Tax=Rubrivirga marina TaxID=1196024 RepID=A0A271J2V3_9BACT|nr:hypothetical protein BSZ37_13050 [Rubrivirga marina]